MKIGINARFFGELSNGIGQVTFNVIKTLIKNARTDLKAGLFQPGDDSDVSSKQLRRLAGNLEFVLYLEEDVDFQLPDSFHKHILPPALKCFGSTKKIWWESKQLPSAVRSDGCDAFISLYQSATVIPSGIPHVMVIHDIIPKLFPQYAKKISRRLHLWLVDRAILRASHCIAVSHCTKNDLIKHMGIASEVVTTLYVAADPLFEKQLSSHETDEVLKKYHLTPGYIHHGGGMQERKNAKGVLQAYRMLVEENRTHHFTDSLPKLVITGTLYTNNPLATDVEELVKKFGIEKEVILLGHVSHSDLPAIYKGASVFVYPSHYEGFGLPLLEAMHQGVPVITAKTSSLPEVGGSAVLYCDPNDPEDIAKAMRTVLSSTQVQKDLAFRGRQRATAFAWDPFVREMLRITVNLSQSSKKYFKML